MNVGYLGPQGTFSEEAAARYYANAQVHLTPFPSIPSVLEAVAAGTIDRGVVPIENSIEGSVSITLAGLLDHPDLFIDGGMVLPIVQNLMAKPGTVLNEVCEVWSHPQGIAQCRLFLHELGVTVKTFDSTAAAAAAVANTSRSDVAAIAPVSSADAFHLDVLRNDIQDYKANHTRFGVVGKERRLDVAAEKTMMAITPSEEHSGVLANVLNVFAALRLNLTWIQSRPTGLRLGTYQFLMDIEGGESPANIDKAVTILETLGHHVRVLGHYNTVAL